MTQSHGRRYEHTLSGGLADVTPEEVWVTTAGYSGNARVDGCDIVVTVDPRLQTMHETPQFNIEAKKRRGDGGKRVSGVLQGSGTDETGVEELWRLVETTPRWADPILAIKFTNRKLLVLDARWVLAELDELDHYGMRPDEQLDAIDPRLTPSENVSMVKPALDAWPSARAAQSDERVLAETLGLPIDND